MAIDTKAFVKKPGEGNQSGPISVVDQEIKSPKATATSFYISKGEASNAQLEEKNIIMPLSKKQMWEIKEKNTTIEVKL